MTYEKAMDHLIYMPHMEGLRLTVTQGNPHDPNTWYPDYKPMGMGMSFYQPMSIEIQMIERHDPYFDNTVKHVQTPPTGRDQKQHNHIQMLNKKGRR